MSSLVYMHMYIYMDASIYLHNYLHDIYPYLQDVEDEASMSDVSEDESEEEVMGDYMADDAYSFIYI